MVRNGRWRGAADGVVMRALNVHGGAARPWVMASSGTTVAMRLKSDLGPCEVIMGPLNGKHQVAFVALRLYCILTAGQVGVTGGRG
jgi:hypothetical protein